MLHFYIKPVYHCPLNSLCGKMGILYLDSVVEVKRIATLLRVLKQLRLLPKRSLARDIKVYGGAGGNANTNLLCFL